MVLKTKYMSTIENYLQLWIIQKWEKENQELLRKKLSKINNNNNIIIINNNSINNNNGNGNQQRWTAANHPVECNKDNNNDTDNKQKCNQALRIFCDYKVNRNRQLYCLMYYVRPLVSVLHTPLTLYLRPPTGTFVVGVHFSLTFVSSIMATDTLRAAGPWEKTYR